MEVKAYFFDTYAFLEIIIGNPAYAPYQNVGIITTKMNLMEMHNALLRKFDLDTADKYFYRFLKFCVLPEDQEIRDASILRAKWKKQDISYIDCLGFVIARKRNLAFLTGDKQFERIKGVQFVK